MVKYICIRLLTAFSAMFLPNYACFAATEAEQHGYHAFTFSELTIIANVQEQGFAAYSESLEKAVILQTEIESLLETPSQHTLNEARRAWIAAREPYSFTEVYRFIFPAIDEWEGSVNAWPVDEGLIDYVNSDAHQQGDDNPYASVNIIANKEPIINGQRIDASVLSAEFIKHQLHEAGDIETNVATGFHAIEFLLWGQDLNGTGEGAGERPWTDFSIEHCSHGNCDRRGEYLRSVTQLLVDDLRVMVAAWDFEGDITRVMLSADPIEFMRHIMMGVATFIQVELVSERMRLPLTLGDPEGEHDCFSDQTHASILNNFLGVRMLLTSHYRDVVKNPYMMLEFFPSFSALQNSLNGTEKSLRLIYDSAEGIDNSSQINQKFDQLIAKDNTAGNVLIADAIQRLGVLSLRLIRSANAFHQ